MCSNPFKQEVFRPSQGATNAPSRQAVPRPESIFAPIRIFGKAYNGLSEPTGTDGARQVRGARGVINSTSLNALGLSGSTFTVAYSTPWMPLTANPPVAVLAMVAWNSGRS